MHWYTMCIYAPEYVQHLSFDTDSSTGLVFSMDICTFHSLCSACIIMRIFMHGPVCPRHMLEYSYDLWRAT